MSLTDEQNARIAELRRIRLWLESGADDTAREAYWREVVTSRRAKVDEILADVTGRICTSREHGAAITRIKEVLGDTVPDRDRRAELTAAAAAKRHMLPADLVTAIMTALQDDVDDAPEDAYGELKRVPKKPGVGDPSTASAVDAAIALIRGGA